MNSHKPATLFFSETLVHSNKANEFRYMLGFDNCFVVSSIGRSGGLALFWQNSFNCIVLNYSNNHINVEVNDSSRGHWQLTGFYGFPESGRRRDSWNFLRSLSNDISLPWCILGDFNDILDVEEKRGGSVRARWLINGFRHAASDASLVDVFMEVEERLDRALTNASWFQLFPNAKVENLVAPTSDHYQMDILKLNIFQWDLEEYNNLNL
ncbi:endonuclease/exonuclease/phosphatase family protein [Medicago truncatula]|uniref:Endonuclease/exonuclease/phosphatase family protein n=1 Tax=Medicago truncatula TaxID=3880 RepID=A0A072V9H7_MEDTR|nr:endonuclease/exonuclease/phosphatase family protein [Medicago truncatula]